MCGFAGFVGTPDSELLQRMGLSVRHRGPDGNENYSDGACSLVHYRLSIIDLSTAGRQPMKTADGRFVIAYNGEIYNYRELRKQYESEGWKLNHVRTQNVFCSPRLCIIFTISINFTEYFHSYFGIRKNTSATSRAIEWE